MSAKQLLIATLAVSFGLGAAAGESDTPVKKPDDTWTRISGTVTSAGPESFRMDYGDGIVTVEMEDWEEYGEEFVLTPGDRATVFGEVDNDFYEEDSVEASSLYVEDLNSYFYASDTAAEKVGDWVVQTPVEPGETTYLGNVTSVDGGHDPHAVQPTRRRGLPARRQGRSRQCQRDDRSRLLPGPPHRGGNRGDSARRSRLIRATISPDPEGKTQRASEAGCGVALRFTGFREVILAARLHIQSPTGPGKRVACPV